MQQSICVEQQNFEFLSIKQTLFQPNNAISINIQELDFERSHCLYEKQQKETKKKLGHLSIYPAKELKKYF